jgi:HEAT repeat protein
VKLSLLFQGGKVPREVARVAAFENDRNVAGLIQMLDSDVRGMTQLSFIRGKAAMALGRLGDPRAIPHLVEMRHDPEGGVRMYVLDALGRLGTKQAESALVEGLTDAVPIVQMSAAEALGRMGAVDAIPRLRNTVDSDPNPEVRLYAVESLIVLGDETARARVPEVLSAISRRVRGHPRWKRLREVAETGETLSPWYPAWE